VRRLCGAVQDDQLTVWGRLSSFGNRVVTSLHDPTRLVADPGPIRVVARPVVRCHRPVSPGGGQHRENAAPTGPPIAVR